MSNLCCKMCGESLEGLGEEYSFSCPSCGIESTLPKHSARVREKYYNKGNLLRLEGKFEDAFNIYQTLISEYETDPEAHWCAVLCLYGIIYKEEEGELLPTCQCPQEVSILQNPLYLKVLELTEDSHSKKLYKAEALLISEIQEPTPDDSPPPSESGTTPPPDDSPPPSESDSPSTTPVAETPLPDCIDTEEFKTVFSNMFSGLNESNEEEEAPAPTVTIPEDVPAPAESDSPSTTPVAETPPPDMSGDKAAMTFFSNMLSALNEYDEEQEGEVEQEEPPAPTVTNPDIHSILFGNLPDKNPALSLPEEPAPLPVARIDETPNPSQDTPEESPVPSKTTPEESTEKPKFCEADLTPEQKERYKENLKRIKKYDKSSTNSALAMTLHLFVFAICCIVDLIMFVGFKLSFWVNEGDTGIFFSRLVAFTVLNFILFAYHIWKMDHLLTKEMAEKEKIMNGDAP